MIENGTVLQNRYLIERKIGSGGMGAVYLAVDQRFDNQVAIKETFYKEDEFSEAFEREARLLNALQHPALPHVTDYFTENGGYFIVMQFIDGADLCDILKRDGAFPVDRVLQWTNELLDALEYLHSQEPPVIHRDIKPHNLKLNARGGIMLLDFGLAKLNKKDATEISVFGYSRTYSPLEQIQGTGTDAHSDIFALGATVYHLLTGTPPINSLMRAAAIVGGNPDPLRMANEIRPEIPEAVANVIHESLALDAKNRFVSAKAMRQALAFAMNEVENTASATIAGNETGLPPMVEKIADLPKTEPEALRPKSPTPSPSIIVDVKAKAPVGNEPNKNRIIWAAAAVLLLIGMATAFYFSRAENPVEPTAPLVNANSSNSSANRESVAESRRKSAERSRSDESKPGVVNGKVSDSPNPPARRKNSDSGADEALTDEAISAEPVDVSRTRIEDSDPEPAEQPRRREKPIPNVMTEQQFEELKRQEKRKRRSSNNEPELD